MKTFKKILIIIIVLISLFSVSGCSQKAQAQPSQTLELQPVQQSQPTEPQPSQSKFDDLKEKLSSLDGVVNVEQLEESPDITENIFDARYIVEFVQPISWSDPNLGTFIQRVFICYKERSKTTVYSCHGYVLNDAFTPDYFRSFNGIELTKHYDANFIEIEYRFFGKSVPDGLSMDSELYWEYLNSEEASKDFHHIITQLKTVIDGSTIFTGVSKGGYTTENMACYFPDDIDAYVSYVAPCCDGINDDRFYRNIYCSIGDTTYGEEQAKCYRDTVIEFEKLILSEEYRSVIQKELFDNFDGKDVVLSPLVTQDEAYEVSVAECATNLWQYNQDFEKVEACLNMPDADEKQREEKISAAKQLYFESDPVLLLNIKGPLSPYYIQSYTEMGNLLYDLSYLRQSGANIKTPPENDATLGMRYSAPVMINSNLKYSSSYRERLLNFFSSTQKDIIKILGKSDTWYAVRMPETGNPHIHVFEVNNSHISTIDMLDESEKKACYDLIDALLNDGIITDNDQSQVMPEAA